MRIALMSAVAAVAALTAGAASAASVDVRDAVARVTVIPENRADIKVEFLSANPRLPLQVRTFGGKTIVDGDLDRRIHVSPAADLRKLDLVEVLTKPQADLRAQVP